MIRYLRNRLKPTADAGFAMIVAIGVMFVSGLLVVAAFTAAQGDITLSHRDSSGKRAYYAALAGIQDYEYQLEENPDYWESCESPSGNVREPPETDEKPAESYVVTPLERQEVAGAAKAVNAETCKQNPFSTMIQKTGAAANTFRVESVGTAGESKRAIMATFKVKGFLNYVYFTQYEDEDIGLYNGPSECENYYWERKNASCETIVFVSKDKINGPMHTDDAPAICGTPTFGVANHNPEDVVEFGGAPYEYECSEKAKPIYNDKQKTWTKATPLIPPESDRSLEKYAKEESSTDVLTGVTHIVMNGTSNQLEVTTYRGGKEGKELMPWPKDGLIYVRTGTTCPRYEPDNSDTSSEESAALKDECGNVYVSGTYSQALTIGAENDVIINGSIYPTSVAGKLGSEPSGTATLGLIASNYVRVYHPVEKCSSGYGGETCSNASGSLTNPWIYAAILSTGHSFVVDNYGLGSSLNELNVYGAIAQKFRGIVGTTGGTGYIKNYEYDERLAVDEPPYFLSPLNSGWKVVRETTPEPK